MLILSLLTIGVFMSWVSFRFFGRYAALYVPIAYIAMTVTLMVDQKAGIATGFAAVIFNSFMFQGTLMSFIVPIAGVFIGIHMAKGRVDRFSIVRGAIFIAAATLVAAVSIAAFSGDKIDMAVFPAALANGPYCALAPCRSRRRPLGFAPHSGCLK
jgi:membrane-associated HD superfamily phosphohydrolase